MLYTVSNNPSDWLVTGRHWREQPRSSAARWKFDCWCRRHFFKEFRGLS